MKFTFNPSPNYRTSQSTSGIMKDLTECLLAVLVFAVIYYCGAYGASYGLRIVLLTACSVIAALCTDAVYFKATKQDIRQGILTSYSWVTALILTLISRVSVSYYGMIVCTVIAVFFGKLVFGGFGQNIFNPAAFGEAVIMANFAGSYSEDFVTSATPTTVAKASGWVGEFASQYGGFGNMFLGQYASTIGSTSALLILLCCVFLIWRKDIDWQVPVTYIVTVFVESLIVGAITGSGAQAAVYNVLAGGVMFGAVFMATDPVTSPVSMPGRVVFAFGAASLAMIIRWKSNFADGVLFGILLMNMLTPAIDKLFDGNQIKDAAKFRKNVLITCVCFFAVTLGVGASLKTSAEEEDSTAAAPAAATAAAASSDSASSGSSSASGIALNGDFADNEASCELTGDNVYHCTAKGFGLINNMGGSYSENEADIEVDPSNNSIVSITVTNFGDTAGVGDAAVSDSALTQYAGKTLDDSVDSVSGATFTSDSIASMASAALKMAAGN